jgi:hypothetical protein
MIPSARFKVFSIVYGAAYMGLFLCSEFTKVALFRYYPVLESWSREALPLETAGPPILWYSWLVGALVISLALSLAVPRKWAARMPHGWIWGVSVVLLLGILVYERRWFY